VKRLIVWLLETSCEALVLSGFLLALGLQWVQSRPFHESLASDFLVFLLGTVGVFMPYSGFLLSTAIFRVFSGSRRLWVYPAIAAALFVVHLRLLGIVLDGYRGMASWKTAWPLVAELNAGGACIVFGCTYAGNLLLRKWLLAAGNSDVG
jgi:hypothetical protein